MTKGTYASVVCVALVVTAASRATAQGDPGAGFLIFEACLGCHSLVPDRSEAGPSLSGLFGRRVGSLPSVAAYSPTMQAARFVWDSASLEAFLADPNSVAPGSPAHHEPIASSESRADLIAFLKHATAAPPPQAASPALVAAEPVAAGGVIVSIDGPSALTLDHGNIPGVMPAMTMPYAAKSPDVLKGLKPGDRVDFTVDPATLTILSIRPAKGR
jgi:cytochrome c